MPEQRKSLNDREQRALEHARDVLAEAPRSIGPALFTEWYGEVRRTLAELVQALDPADGDDEEPVLAPVMRAYRDHVSGYCTCGGHVSRAGVFTPREVTA